ncbi:hypothetical protein CR513_55326, partial [Mucuna pruriens]
MLTQFYNPLLRCFTFKDFQLAPTLEEYERLLGMPLAKSPLYFPKGHHPSWASVAKLLRMPESEIEDYVDLVVLGAYLGKHNQGENPIIEVLANTYYTLDDCTSLLYLWMTAHLFHSKKKTTCPIEDHH